MELFKPSEILFVSHRISYLLKKIDIHFQKICHFSIMILTSNNLTFFNTSPKFSLIRNTYTFLFSNVRALLLKSCCTTTAIFFSTACKQDNLTIYIIYVASQRHMFWLRVKYNKFYIQIKFFNVFVWVGSLVYK